MYVFEMCGCVCLKYTKGRTGKLTFTEYYFIIKKLTCSAKNYKKVQQNQLESKYLSLLDNTYWQLVPSYICHVKQKYRYDPH